MPVLSRPEQGNLHFLGLSTEVGDGGGPSMHNHISGDHPGLYQNGSETPRGQDTRAAGTAGRMVRAAVMQEKRVAVPHW